jgi:DNA end-binding protein Ku
MLWPDEVRKPDFGFLDEDIDVRPQELAMAGSLIETLSGEFDPGQYKDSYREALQEVIEAKIAGHEVKQPEQAQPTSGTVVDLMAALRASVEAAKAGKSAGDSGKATQAPAKGAKKSPAKKAPAAKKTPAKAAKPAKKAAAKKVAARKSA